MTNKFVTPKNSCKKYVRGNCINGFTLIEMAIVLLVVSLLLGGLLVPLSTQVQQRKIAETQQMLDEIKEALIGYGASHADVDNHPYLPCPDADNDGIEDRKAGGDCLQKGGNLPWVTLGTAKADGWGNRFHYQVSPNFSNANFTLGSPSAGFTLSSPPSTLKVKTRDNTKSLSALISDAPAVVLSYGPNGYGAIHEDGSSQTAAPAQNTDEIGNIGINITTFISRLPSAVQPAGGCSDSAAGVPYCEFDDMVAWLSPNILFNRMIAAGRLP